MSEWWTYRPSDFLLFAPRTYYRLFELYNSEIWPLQIVGLLAGAAILVLLRSGFEWRGRAIAAILAACWLWIAVAFHWQHYATINWAAPYFAAGFTIQALLLLWIGLARDPLTLAPLASNRARIGRAVAAFAVIAQPWIGTLLGRTWGQLEFFGVAPDTTVVATLGVLVATRQARWLLPIPLLWCFISGITLWTFKSAG